MRVFNRIIILPLLLLILFTACKNNSDSSNWLDSLSDAKKLAQKEDKRILLLFSDYESSEESMRIKENIFSVEEFWKTVTEYFVPVDIDLNYRVFQNLLTGDNSWNSPDIEKMKKKLRQNMKNAYMYSLKSCPSFYILSKEGFVLASFSGSGLNSPEDFAKLYADNLFKASSVEEKLFAVRTSSGLKKVYAIDDFYNATEFNYRPLLFDLEKQVKNIDEKNETGLVSKFIIAETQAKVHKLFSSGSSEEKASKIYVKAAKDKLLSAISKQFCYYWAAAYLESSKDKNLALFNHYIDLAIKAAPDSKYVPELEKMKEIEK